MKKEKKIGPIEQKIKKSLDELDDLLHEDLLKPSPKKGPIDRFDELLHKDLKEILKKEHNGKDEDPSVLRYIELLLKDRFVATVSPSSKFIIRRVLKAMDLKHAKVVVEYGPADGVITQPILDHLPKDAMLIAIERNAEFFNRLKLIKDPRFHPVFGDVRDIEQHLHRFGVEKADRIVSGIPFSYLTEEERLVLLTSTHGRLGAEGRFVAYQVTTHLIPLLKRYFRDVDTEFEIRNVPPHFVFTAYK
jgi:phospholipid N-methyltransferase